MQLLIKEIRKKGRVLPGNVLKVDSFLNHQLDISLMEKIGRELAERYKQEKVEKILTIESSGIAVACFVSKYLGYLPVVFAKKDNASNMSEQCYSSSAFSFTRNREFTIKVAKEFLDKNERILIIDDFLAEGSAGLALLKIIRQAEAVSVGFGIVIEKGFQNGRSKLESEGQRVESLAIIKEFVNNEVVFSS